MEHPSIASSPVFEQPLKHDRGAPAQPVSWRTALPGFAPPALTGWVFPRIPPTHIILGLELHKRLCHFLAPLGLFSFSRSGITRSKQRNRRLWVSAAKVLSREAGPSSASTAHRPTALSPALAATTKLGACQKNG